MKKIELSHSASVAIKCTENPDDVVDTEEEMYFEDLTITGKYSDYDILEEEKEIITKVGKLSSHKYVDNVDTESDKRNQVNMSDDKDSA